MPQQNVFFSNPYTLTYSALGFITALTQTLLLRQLMAEVAGSELVLPLGLTVWLTTAALGAVLSPLIRLPRTIRFFSVLLLLTICISVLLLYLAAPLIAWFSPVSGELLPLRTLLPAITLLLAPVSFLSGFMFPLAVSEKTIPLTAAYAAECLGMALGSLFFYAGMALSGSSAAVSGLGAALTASTALSVLLPRRKWITLSLIILFVAAANQPLYTLLHSRRYLPDTLEGSYELASGRLDVTSGKGQTTYYHDSIPFAVTEDNRFSDELARFALAMHPKPLHIAAFGSTANGIANSLALYQELRELLLIEEDRLLFTAAQNEIPAKAEIVAADPIRYLTAENKTFDLLLFNLAEPSTIAANRLYTLEFMQHAEQRLALGGSIVFIVPGNAEVVRPERAALIASLYATAGATLGRCVIIGATATLLACGNNVSDSADTVIARLSEKGLVSGWVNETLIREHLNPLMQLRYRAVLEETTAAINRIDDPAAYRSALFLRFAKEGRTLHRAAAILTSQPIITGIIILGLMFVLTALFAALMRVTYRAASGLFTAAGVGFGVQILLLFRYQAACGRVYALLALFLCAAALGLWGGFILATRFSCLGRYGMAFLAAAALAAGFIPAHPSAEILFFAVALCTAFAQGAALKHYARCMTTHTQTFYALDAAGSALFGLLIGLFGFALFSAAYLALFCTATTILALGLGVLFDRRWS